MNQSPFITPAKYHLQRAAKVALVIALLAAVRPALALWDSAQPEPEVTIVSHTTTPADQTNALATAVSSGLDEVLTTGKNPPSLSVTAALVKEMGAKDPLLVYRPNARWPLASISKLMASVVALETLGASTIVTVSQEAVDTEGEAGALKAGDRYTIIDLVRAMLVVSSNDAAIAAAQAYDKKQLGAEAYEQALNKTALFTAAMQEKARSLGMQQTYYGDPSGLSVVNQSVIADLELLMNYISAQHPELLEITRKKEGSILERRSMTRCTLANINEFAGRSDFVGGKTGRTDEASGNLLSIFSYEGKRYLIIVLGTEHRFDETRKLYDWVREINQPLF